MVIVAVMVTMVMGGRVGDGRPRIGSAEDVQNVEWLVVWGLSPEVEGGKEGRGWRVVTEAVCAHGRGFSLTNPGTLNTKRGALRLWDCLSYG